MVFVKSVAVFCLHKVSYLTDGLYMYESSSQDLQIPLILSKLLGKSKMPARHFFSGSVSPWLIFSQLLSFYYGHQGQQVQSQRGHPAICASAPVVVLSNAGQFPGR
jgi:hypothetical protein